MKNWFVVSRSKRSRLENIFDKIVSPLLGPPMRMIESQIVEAETKEEAKAKAKIPEGWEYTLREATEEDLKGMTCD